MTLNTTGRHNSVRVLWLLLTLLLALGSAGQSLSADPKTDASSGEKKGDIQALLKEQSELLEQVAQSKVDRYLGHPTNLEAVCESCRQALRAQLLILTAPSERLETIRKAKQRADKFVDAAKVGLEAGLVGEAAVSEAKAFVLEMRIALLNEEEAQQRSKK